jgi:hypothetical protein
MVMNPIDKLLLALAVALTAVAWLVILTAAGASTPTLAAVVLAISTFAGVGLALFVGPRPE